MNHFSVLVKSICYLAVALMLVLIPPKIATATVSGDYTYTATDFVTRFYEECLNRNPDQAGLNYWVDELVNGYKTGADVAYGFVNSYEFQSRVLTDSEYLDILYEAFFNRAADASGKTYWLSQIDGGLSRLEVLAGFVKANEFGQLCDDYGIDRYPKYRVIYDYNSSVSGQTGTVPVDTNRYTAGDTVTVLGNGSLGWYGFRFSGWNTEAGGNGIDYYDGDTFTMGNQNITLYAQWIPLRHWITYDGNGNTSGDVPPVLGPEWEGETHTVRENSGELARTGYTFAGWNTTADGSGTGYEAGDTFIIGTNNVTLYAEWILNPQNIEAFVTRFYAECLGRQPDQAGLDYWADSLVSGASTGADVAYGFVYSDEFQANVMTDEEYLDVLFTAFFNRDPDPSGRSYWLGFMDGGASRLEVLAGFVNADEFRDLCNQYGIAAGIINT